jgi:hypothetical protein
MDAKGTRLISITLFNHSQRCCGNEHRPACLILSDDGDAQARSPGSFAECGRKLHGDGVIVTRGNRRTVVSAVPRGPEKGPGAKLARMLRRVATCNRRRRFRHIAMEDFLNFDISAPGRERPPRRARAGRTGRPGNAKADRPELQAGEPIDIYHWAAVALVTSLMCAVLAYAAGTPTLSRASNVTSMVFGAMGSVLLLAGIVRGLRSRLAGAAVAEQPQ